MITLLFYIPFTIIVVENDVDRETTRELLGTDRIVSDIKDVLLQDSVHVREEEGVEIGGIPSKVRTFNNDRFQVIVNDNEVLYEGVVRTQSYIKSSVIEFWANQLAKQEKDKYKSGLLTPTSTKVERDDGGHYIYKLVYQFVHEDHRDTILIDRDLTELYAKPIHNTLIYGGVTLVFLYFAVILISYLTQVWKIREMRQVIKEQQRVLAMSGPEKNTNVGQEYSKFLEEVSDLMIELHNRGQEVYISNKNVLQDISHEMASSITEIKNSVDLIRYYGIEDQEHVEKRLEIIEEAALNISTIQNTFIDLARVENNESLGEPATYNVQELIDLAVGQASHQYRKIHFLHHVDNGIKKYIRMHREHFLLIMRTLLGNAAKYSNGSDKVVIELINSPEYDDELAIKITNWGAYIPVRERELIFNRYYRAENVRSSKPGTGIGLHMVKKVLELYNGRIEIESEELKEETSFIVIFPGVKNEEGKDSEKTS